MPRRTKGRDASPSRELAQLVLVMYHFLQQPENECRLGLKFKVGNWKFKPKHLSNLCMYTYSLAPADFSGAVFTCAFFQKMLFLLYKLRNVFLVTNDLSAAD